MRNLFYSKLIFLFLSIYTVFISFFKAIFGDYLLFIFCLIFFIFYFAIFLQSKLNKISIKLLSIITIILFFYILLNNFYKNTTFITILIGSYSTFFPIIFWLIIFSTLNNNDKIILFHYMINVIFLISIFNSFLAIYQFYFDTSLFGFNIHSQYSDDTLMSINNVSKRSTSLIGSPQILGFFSFLSISTLFVKKNIKYNYLIFLLHFVAGVLSGSSAFIGCFLIFIFSFYNIFNLKNIIKFLPILIIVIIFTFNTIDNEFANFSTFDINILSHLPFYLETLNNITFFGKGLAFSDRVLETFYKGSPPPGWISTESYLLKILFELGVFGIFIFLIFYFYIFINKTQNNLINKYLKSLILASFANMIFTPLFTAVTISLIIWPILLLSTQKIYQNENII